MPFGNKLRDYFDGYQSAQAHIASILARLQSGKDELLKDNAAIDVERQALWAAMGRLEQMIHVAKALDAELEAKATELDYDRSRARPRRCARRALFYVRQRTTDLLTQMAVSVQGYLALDLVKKNNIELVKGVDRASTTTVAALRTAVTVAQALTNQKLVLQQITALNTTTANIIDSTAEHAAHADRRRSTSRPRRRPFRSRRSSARSRTSTRPWTRSTTFKGKALDQHEDHGRRAERRGREVARLHRARRGRCARRRARTAGEPFRLTD